MLQSIPPATNYRDFVLNTRFEDLPNDVVARAQDLVLDLLGVGIAARDLDAARLGRETAIRLFNAGPGAPTARLLMDGRTASLAGATYAGATQIDSLDAHDGYSLAKGHAGCGLLPALLAYAERHPNLSGQAFISTLVIGYEIACRAGVALHATTADYHTSGAWVALAVAAMGIRLEGGDPETLRQAVGIAEYHGPRSQMMREIDNPTMLHDGSGWGAMVGVSAAELALAGFTGAPAVTIEREDADQHWRDLGSRWLTLEQNIKLFPVCRWAHAPIHAALELRAAHNLDTDQISKIEIFAFHEATRLAQDVPESTGKAQYSITYPVAAALVNGKLTAEEVSGACFSDPHIMNLMRKSTIHECDHCNAKFPEDRLGRTVITTTGGDRLDSGIVQAPGEHTAPIDRAGLIEKFRKFTNAVLPNESSKQIERATFSLSNDGFSVSELTSLLYHPQAQGH